MFKKGLVELEGRKRCLEYWIPTLWAPEIFILAPLKSDLGAMDAGKEYVIARYAGIGCMVAIMTPM